MRFSAPAAPTSSPFHPPWCGALIGTPLVQGADVTKNRSRRSGRRNGTGIRVKVPEAVESAAGGSRPAARLTPGRVSVGAVRRDRFAQPDAVLPAVDLAQIVDVV